MQRKKKRSIIFELHSIPIKLGRIKAKLLSNRSLCKRLYLVSYSIPLSCMVVLLLGFSVVINPSLFKSGSGYAIDVATVSDSTLDTPPQGEGEVVESQNDIIAQADDGTAYAMGRAAMPSTVSLTVGGAGRNDEVETGVGVTAYRSHTVDVTVSDVQEYFLKISGSPELAPPEGGTAVPGVGSDGGSAIVKGSEMHSNTWGYAWDSDRTTAAADEDMMYTSIPSASTSLTVPNLVDGNAVFTGKLNFAAKFAATSVLGNYTSGVQLSLIATPKSNTESNHGFWYNASGAPTGLDSGTASMQDAAANFCTGNSQVGIGWTVELEDNRDGKTYTIVKLADGKCWMQENLALEADPEKYPDGMTLAPGDTDLPSGTTWTLPASTTSWDKTDNTKAQVATGSTVMSGWKEGYGNYYSWAAATAGTGNSVSLNDSVATGSICPKGWKLPTGGSGGGQFQTLFGVSGANLGSDYATKFANVQAAPYKFPAAGGYNGSLYNAGAVGFYWSRTSYSSSNAYRLYFGSGDFGSGTNFGNRYGGFSVRCVQDADGVWEGNTGTGGPLDTGIRNMQDITKANFTTKYCAASQNSLVSVGSTIKLFDARDSKEYTIVKLADGNCWMQENLALAGGTTIRSTDSDITASSWTLPTSATSSWNTSDNTISQMKNGAINMAVNSSSAGDGKGWQPGYGNYYSWCAATAGTCSSATSSGQNAPSSICPKGWKLPTGNTNGQFYNALNGLNFTTVQAAPYKFPAAGYLNSSAQLYGPGTNGYYWSSTPYSNGYSGAYYLYFGSGNFRPGTSNNYRYYGYSVRCVAEPVS